MTGHGIQSLRVGKPHFGAPHCPGHCSHGVGFGDLGRRMGGEPFGGGIDVSGVGAAHAHFLHVDGVVPHIHVGHAAVALLQVAPQLGDRRVDRHVIAYAAQSAVYKGHVPVGRHRIGSFGPGHGVGEDGHIHLA